MSEIAHKWRFFRAGGLDQVRLETGADLANLHTLDQKLWVALACPVAGLEFDEGTLKALDTDQDGRVRAPEILAAIAFCAEALRDLDGLLTGTDVVPVAKLRDDTDTGRKIRASVRQIFEALGKPEATSFSLADVADTGPIFTRSRFNGDGIVTQKSAQDADLAQAVADLIAVVGSDVDRTGEAGLTQARIDAAFDALAAWLAWRDARPAGPADAELDAFEAVAAKIDDWFARCAITGFDPRAKDLLDPAELAFAPGVLTEAAAEALPLARVASDAVLRAEAINPAWRARFAALGAPTLSAPEWTGIKARFAPLVAWRAARPPVDAEKIRGLAGTDVRARLTALVVEDQGFAEAFAGIAQVGLLARYHRDLYPLLRNFVSFDDFYAPGRKSVFQAGRLYLDGRSCDLCVRVADPGRHAAMAALSKCYLAYLTCTRVGGAAMQIAAVFSAGDSDFLMVGRNGVFYDRQGRDWDATITKVVDNPISLREAFFAPYKKFVRFVEDQINARAAAADQASTAKLSATAADPKVAPKPAFDLSTLALIGVAVSGAAAVVGGLLEAFFGLGIWMPLGLLGLVLLISGPSMAIAALKLRQRNLGPILDANGWAINGRVAVNIPFGGSLTQIPRFPANSHRTLTDPYLERRSPWVYVARIVATAAFAVGATAFAYHQGWLPAAVEQPLAVLGVPRHLVNEKARAQVSVDEQRIVVKSAQDQLAAARAELDARVAAGAPPDARLQRAQNRVTRAEEKLARAEDKLDTYEGRLEVATELLDVAIDADEARVAAAAP